MVRQCQRCCSIRVVFLTADIGRIAYTRVGEVELDKVPSGLGVSSEDNFLHFYWCLNCGQIQGKWPVSRTALEPPPLPKRSPP